MGLPHRDEYSQPDTPEPPRDGIPNRVQDKLEPRRERGFFRPFFWVLFAIAIAAVIWWASTAYQGNRGNPNATLQPNQVHPTEALVVRDVGLLVTRPENTATIGRAVQVQDAMVQSAMGDHKFWIGQDGQRVFVFFPDNLRVTNAQDKPAHLQPGGTVFVNGLVERAPTVDQAMRQWGLSPADADELVNRDGLWIKADRVQVVEHPPVQNQPWTPKPKK